MTLYLTLFIAGLLTILLPCILPLIPIVLGVSIVGRSKWRPFLTIAGMIVSFVGFTFLLLVVLSRFVELADYIRIATYYILLLFGIGFITHNRKPQLVGALAGSLFFFAKGIPAVIVAALVGMIAMYFGERAASNLQQIGTSIQNKARKDLGSDSPLTAFIIGLTLGLIWVPCAGPALGFALTLVREEPGFRAALALTSYAFGTAVPLLAIGYGGQTAVHSVHAVSRFSGIIKQIAGLLLVLTAIALQLHFFEKAQILLLEKTNFGDLGTRIEEKLFKRDMFETKSSDTPNKLSDLPIIMKAPEFQGLGPWHNSEPLTLSSLKGKVVLVDFWTYSCINCIRTLPYIKQYWEKYKDSPFVLIGVHTPEFVFEKSESNVAEAIRRHGLTYPIAQDNDFGTWRAFANRFWPAKYLIDAKGNIRYTHFGEGNYEETDMAIMSLLAEIGHEMSGDTVSQEETGGRRQISPETYLGSRSWPALGNKKGDPSDSVISYKTPSSMKLNEYYLAGDWQLRDEERQVLVKDGGEIRMKFLGSEINLVMGLEDGSESINTEVEIDGKKEKSFVIDRHDLYTLYEGKYGEHEMILRIQSSGASAYAFTFGSN